MKHYIFLSLLFASTTCYAYQCPDIKDFYQDKNNIWHLTKLPPTPPGTEWAPMTQGPLAPTTHNINYFAVDLTFGWWPYRVNCYYGKSGEPFMGIQLHVGDTQKPKSLPGSNFNDNECATSPDQCQFDVTD